MVTTRTRGGAKKAPAKKAPAKKKIEKKKAAPVAAKKAASGGALVVEIDLHALAHCKRRPRRGFSSRNSRRVPFL